MTNIDDMTEVIVIVSIIVVIILFMWCVYYWLDLDAKYEQKIVVPKHTDHMAEKMRVRRALEKEKSGDMLDSKYVYVTDGAMGKIYHNVNCSTLLVTPYKKVTLGSVKDSYKPCSICWYKVSGRNYF